MLVTQDRKFIFENSTILFKWLILVNNSNFLLILLIFLTKCTFSTRFKINKLLLHLIYYYYNFWVENIETTFVF